MANGIIPLPASRRILRSLWRITLMALNVGNVDEITSAEMFAVDDPALPNQQERAVEERIAEAIRSNAQAGAVDWEAVSDWALTELMNVYGA
jgi:hypothetical protein